MSDLERLMTEAWEARALVIATVTDDAALLAAVSAGVIGRRRARVMGVAAAALLPVVAVGAGTMLWLGPDAPEPAVTPTPTTTESPSPSPSAEPTTSPEPSPSVTSSPVIEAATWAELSDTQRPAWVTDQDSRLPAAREMQDWVWDYVDDTWTVQVHRIEHSELWVTDVWEEGEDFVGPQNLYLEAPDGELILLYELRRDMTVDVLAVDMDARLAWTNRYAVGDGWYVVQVNLLTGAATESWGAGAVPDDRRTEWGVVDVDALGMLRDGRELWFVADYDWNPDMLFVREEGDRFALLPWQDAWEAAVGDDGIAWISDTVIWLSEDLTYAVYLTQRPGVPQDASGTATSGEATWMVVDLVSGQWRFEESSTPQTLCKPQRDTWLTGTYEDPGPLHAVCQPEPEDFEYRPWVLSVDGPPVAAQ